jgi:hypothetical protein
MATFHFIGGSRHEQVQNSGLEGIETPPKYARKRWTVDVTDSALLADDDMIFLFHDTITARGSDAVAATSPRF